ncbi:Crp/Fnr family transcriptional regulator [Aquimarina litoralis]|uniref:Crp/Fnr family transcriptional regulator n=1 Tax=Aquimarina litoralis TaxID=584605 RepID=UPI001C570221|nr:Crp/Fnr family transcriptional regulator [Aquimarina litoralis]MBW1296078.1 helix-turn-helix domain-containing protein [Aquimarina litoralis]
MSLTSLNTLILENQGSANHYRKKEIIVHGTHFYKKVYFIKNGIVKISSITKNGEEIIPLLLTSGNFFGAKPTIDCFYFDYTCEAYYSHTEIQEYDLTFFQKIIIDNKINDQDFLGIFCKQYKELERRIKTLYIRNAEQRLLNVFVEFKDKFDYQLDSKNNIIICMPLNQEEMSNYIRVTRVTINKIINKLKRNLLIESDQNTLTLTKKFFEYHKSF